MRKNPKIILIVRNFDMHTLNDNLHSALIQVVASHPDLRVKDIAQHLADDHELEVPLPTLYRKVSSCVSEQIFIKHAGKISLNLVWVSKLMRFAESLSNTLSTGSVSFSELPKKDGDVSILSAPSLLDLDSYWNHYLVALVRQSKKKNLRGYNAHTWFCLGAGSSELSLFEALSSLGASINFSIGGQTFLDIYGRQLYENIGLEVQNYVDPNGFLPLELERGVIWTIDDYVLSFVMPEALQVHFDFFFSRIEKISDFNPSLFSNVFSMKQNCEILVRKDKDSASYWRSVLA